jgi:hypothetical protein
VLLAADVTIAVIRNIAGRKLIPAIFLTVVITNEIAI